ncbi:MAG: GNAT family N-acetyltransferase [Coprobacillus sp.]
MIKYRNIYTDRLIIRHFTIDDLDDFLCIMKDEVVNEFLPWFPLQTRLEAQQMLENSFLNTYKNTESFRYAICLKDDNRAIGYVNLANNESYDFGYGLRKEYWHQGIVSEAAKAVLDIIKTSSVPFITATHDVKNMHSGNVMKKIGMEYKYSYEEVVQPKNTKVIFRMYQLNFDDSDYVYKKYWDQHPHFIEDIK